MMPTTIRIPTHTPALKISPTTAHPPRSPIIKTNRKRTIFLNIHILEQPLQIQYLSAKQKRLQHTRCVLYATSWVPHWYLIATSDSEYPKSTQRVPKEYPKSTQRGGSEEQVSFVTRFPVTRPKFYRRPSHFRKNGRGLTYICFNEFAVNWVYFFSMHIFQHKKC